MNFFVVEEGWGRRLGTCLQVGGRGSRQRTLGKVWGDHRPHHNIHRDSHAFDLDPLEYMASLPSNSILAFPLHARN